MIYFYVFSVYLGTFLEKYFSNNKFSILLETLKKEKKNLKNTFIWSYKKNITTSNKIYLYFYYAGNRVRKELKLKTFYTRISQPLADKPSAKKSICKNDF